MAIGISAVNDAPVNTVPTAKTTAEDTLKVITGLRIDDIDAGGSTLTVTLTVQHGSLVVTGGSATIAGSGTGTVTLTGVENLLKVESRAKLLNPRWYEAMLEHGVYVIGFSFPVVPQGKARIRTQISAALTVEDIDLAVKAFRQSR